jgi:hypothetical protein
MMGSYSAEIGSAITPGLAGTAVMTTPMVPGPRMGMPKMDKIGMLGTMVTAGEGLVAAPASRRAGPAWRPASSSKLEVVRWISPRYVTFPT